MRFRLHSSHSFLCEPLALPRHSFAAQFDATHSTVDHCTSREIDIIDILTIVENDRYRRPDGRKDILRSGNRWRESRLSRESGREREIMGARNFA